MKQLSKKSVNLIREVIKHVEADPRRFVMGDWGTHYSPEEVKNSMESIPPCGTQACFAGWTVILNRSKNKREKFAARYDFSKAEEQAQKILGFTSLEAGELFYSGGYSDPQEEIKEVKDILNDIFEDRGMKERV